MTTILPTPNNIIPPVREHIGFGNRTNTFVMDEKS